MHAGMSVPVHAVACARMLTTFLYCFRKDCEVLAEKLDSAGITAAYYHADMEPGTRAASHSAWSSGNIKVRACGMVCFPGSSYGRYVTAGALWTPFSSR